MSKTALRVLVLVFLSLSMSVAIVATASAAPCPGGSGPTCIELRVDDPSSSSSSLWVSSARDTGAMAGQKWINDLENVGFEAPAGRLFTSVSIELECQGPATRLHDVWVYFYLSTYPWAFCETQLIEPPLYPARPHGAPGVNSYILDTIPSDTTCAAGFRRIEIEPFIGSACNIVGVNGFQTAPGADLAIVKTDSPDTPTVNTPTFADGATTQLWPTPGVQGCLPDVYPNWAGPLVNVDSTAPVAGSIQLCYTAEPLAVTLADFGAVQLDGRVQVSWETTSELNNAGFNLYRNTTPDPVGDLLAYVPSQAPGSTQGYVYSYDDADVQPGHTYWYWLEDVSLSGATTLHGPVSVTFNAPTAVGLAGFDAVRSGNRSIAGLALAVGLAVVAGGWTVRRRSRRLLR